MTGNAIELTKRWTKLRAHAVQSAYWNSPHRLNVVPAGRRSGKTELAKRKVVTRALSCVRDWVPRFFVAAPTYAQAKRIYWDDLRALSPKPLIADISISELCITYINGAQIYVIGLDKPARMEGQPWDGGIVDEIGNVKPDAWGANIRPALSDRLGWCDLIGVPEGRNHYYDLSRNAKLRMKKDGAKSEWGHFHWKSADILPAEEIEAARLDLDPLTFKQEYEADFVNFEGRAYYTFDVEDHTAKLKYDPDQPLIFTFDFNVAPGTAAVIQEQRLPGQYKRDKNGLLMLNQPITGTGVIGEVFIPRNSNTPAVCKKLITDWGDHRGRIICYGDATGGASGSAKTEGSDWDLIKLAMRKAFGVQRTFFENRSSNPTERSRVNAVNTRLLNGNNEIHMMVDPEKAPNVVKDLDGVVLLKGGSGEIDKKATPELTHLSDGIGYYIADQFPIAGTNTTKVKIVGH